VSTLISLSSVGAADVEQLLDDAFGPDRHSRTAYLLRREMPLIDHLSFAVVEQQNIVGSIQCWPVAVTGNPLILVGPVAVSPHRQKQGFGHILMHIMLTSIRPHDPAMVLIGDPEYYGRFGFTAEQTGGWSLPGPWDPQRLLLCNPASQTLPSKGRLGPRTSL
jgi:predicted N-acetyltransferase YhbS